jgi:polysaccharide export outer membrane protein
MTSITRLTATLAAAALGAGAVAQEDNAIYRLKANDGIALNVFQEPELQTEVRLTGAGEASFPLIGTVRLAGLTMKEAEDLVTQLYDADYLVSPKLSINLVEVAEEHVTVMGAVNSPGAVAISSGASLDLVSAVSSAGGLAAHADSSRIQLKRAGETKTYDLGALQKTGAGQVLVRHGDRIDVLTSPFANKTVTVVGEVTRPGPVAFPVDGGLDVATAVGVAGGLNEMADAARITVKRGESIYSASMSATGSRGRLLQPGDVISVPKSRFVGKSVTVTGLAARPGPVPFPLDGQLTLQQAIANAGGVARLGNRRKVTVTRTSGGREQTFRFDLEEMAGGNAAPFSLAPGDTIYIPERRF